MKNLKKKLHSPIAGIKQNPVALCAAFVFFLLVCAVGVCADDVGEASFGSTTNGTVITAKSLDYDAKQRVATFKGNVVVSDPEMNIHADELSIALGEENSLKSLVAKGNVMITQADMHGVGDMAEYHVEEGRIVLSGKPRVSRGNDELSGDTITYYRGSGRMVCEPNAVLRFHALPQFKADGIIGE